tara:strand:- start:7803 stop:8135 length:333 start_codon:yes stop_codon:yes gene_type:complete
MKHPDGRTATFKVFSDCVLLSEGSRARHSFEDARKIWYNLVGQGYLPVNKSVVHDMEKFHTAYKDYEYDYEIVNKKHQKNLASKMYEDIMMKYESEYENKNKYSNYALEA